MMRRQRLGRLSTRALCVAGFLLAAAVGPAGIARAADKEPTAEQLEFFEKKIRPVLVEKCYGCHSHQAKKVKGKYLLDSRDGIRKGGESGDAAVVPGDPDKSPLIKAIKRVDDDSAMPPKKAGALTKDQVADFEKWVKDGAADPRKEPDKSEPGKKSAQADDKTSGAKQHWAFVKPTEPAVPTVKNAGWVQSPLDAFVLAGLEAKGMTPSPRADKHTLIRRAYFDLIGLPPTAEEVAAFEADASPDAFAKVVDRLLLSPKYGERWGRYWLDVARYADTKGYVFEAERRFPYSYTYRDYVIRAFNEDLPYDQFLIQQIAADKLDLGNDKRPLAAMGFLTIGRRFLESQPDIIDDRIDVVTRGTMALTVQCARCHDHKFDPIPTQDYYSLYGIFASSVEPATLPTIGDRDQTTASHAFDAKLQARQAAVESYLTEHAGAALKELRSAKKVSDYLLAAQFTGSPEEKNYVPTGELNKKLVAKWTNFLFGSRHGHDPIFATWQAYAAIPSNDFAANSANVTASLFDKPDAAKPIHPLVAAAFKGKAPASMREVADRYGELLSSHSQEEAFADSDKEALRMVLHGLYSPLHATGDDRGHKFLRRDDRTAYMKLKKEADELRVTDPGAPPAAMVLNDSPNPSDTPIFKRGNAGTPGDIAPRRFLKCLSGPDREHFTEGSGRLQLARAIASKDNPLTARVMVNRIWLEHFGTGLVRTPSDFGVRCDPPVHPEILDWLAVQFMNNNWSIKKLHRTILLSNTWQQASDNSNATFASLDPENSLYWRQNRRRKDFEAMRDSYLAVAEHLEPTAGGHAVDITDAFNDRRTVYGFIDRNNLPGMFRTFDFASPDTHSPKRFFTTVPQQALFMLNSPFIERVTRQVFGRKDVQATGGDSTSRVTRLYQTLFGRSPSTEEVSDAVAFVSDEQMQNVVGMTPWRYGFGKYDAVSDRVTSFETLSQFSGNHWVAPASAIANDAKLKWAGLWANGGHPGADSSHAVIRRWVAPADGTVVVSGSISHQQQNSDGILARIVSSSAGQVSAFTVARMDVTTNISGLSVHKGETIDFIVEPRASDSFDTFTWNPTIRLTTARLNGAVAGAEGVIESDAERDFAAVQSASSISPWEKYTQVLLLSNEFAFVD